MIQNKETTVRNLGRLMENFEKLIPVYFICILHLIIAYKSTWICPAVIRSNQNNYVNKIIKYDYIFVHCFV